MKVLLSLIFPVSIDSLCFFPQLHPLISSSITFVLHDTPQHWKKLLIKGCCPPFQWYPPWNLLVVPWGISFKFPRPCLPCYVFVIISNALFILWTYLFPLRTCNITWNLKTPHRLSDVATSRVEVTQLYWSKRSVDINRWKEFQPRVAGLNPTLPESYQGFLMFIERR